MSKHYKPKEFAELLNVSVITLQRWDNDGKLKAFRTPTNRRYYTYEQYLEYIGIHKETDSRKIVIYTRVSTSNQKDDLKNQVEFLRQYANAKGIIVDEVIKVLRKRLERMKKLKKAYKIEINPTDEQKSKIHQTIGVSRFIYNFYIDRNKEIYEREGKFVSGMDFSKWLNNEYIP